MNLVSLVQVMTPNYLENLYNGLKWDQLTKSEKQQFKIAYFEKKSKKSTTPDSGVTTETANSPLNTYTSQEYDYDNESIHYAKRM